MIFVGSRWNMKRCAENITKIVPTTMAKSCLCLAVIYKIFYQTTIHLICLYLYFIFNTFDVCCVLYRNSWDWKPQPIRNRNFHWLVLWFLSDLDEIWNVVQRTLQRSFLYSLIKLQSIWFVYICISYLIHLMFAVSSIEIPEFILIRQRWLSLSILVPIFIMGSWLFIFNNQTSCFYSIDFCSFYIYLEASVFGTWEIFRIIDDVYVIVHVQVGC
jgi:hypothetical protein